MLAFRHLHHRKVAACELSYGATSEASRMKSAMRAFSARSWGVEPIEKSLDAFSQLAGWWTFISELDELIQ
jgi:hypothetical protein